MGDDAAYAKLGLDARRRGAAQHRMAEDLAVGMRSYEWLRNYEWPRSWGGYEGLRVAAQHRMAEDLGVGMRGYEWL